MTESEFVGKWRSRFADNDTFTIDEGDLREFAEDIAATFGSDDPRAVFQEILENQFGKHPAFTTSQHEVNLFLLQMATAQLAVAAPDAPTFSGFDDAANTVAIAHPNFSYADLRYDFNGQVGLLVPADGIIRVGNVAGQVTGYVRAAGGRAQGNKAYSPAFTTSAASVAIKPTAPTIGNFDDGANTLTVFHPQYGMDQLRYDFEGQTGLLVSASGLIEVGNKAGQVTTYVVADVSKNRVEGAKAYSQPFTVGAVVTPPATTPAAPTVFYTSATRRLVATHSLGGTLLFSFQGSLFVPYTGAITVDDEAHDPGEWQFKREASPGYLESPVAFNPAIAAKPTSPVGVLPTVTGLTPASGLVGSSVTISGSNFTGATGVTFNGTVASFTVLNATTISATVPAGATSGKVMVATPSGTGSSAVDFTVTAATNQLPTANAGSDASIQLPTNSIGLLGTGTDADGSVTGYAWRQVSGPNNATGLPANSQNVVAGNLIAGTYQFGFRTTDDKGGQSAEDFVMVTVSTAPVTGVANLFSMFGSQSNGDGSSRMIEFQTNPALSSRNLLRKYPNFWIWNWEVNEWQQLVVGGKTAGGNNHGYYNTTDDLANLGFGFEVAVADELSKTQPGVDYYLIKYAVGGSTIEQWLVGGMYRANLDSRVNAALAGLTARSKTPNFLGNLWNQGEGNHSTPKAEYLAKLNELHNGFFATYLPPATKTVLALYNPQSNPFNVGVRPAQLEYVATHPNARAIYTDNYQYYTNTDDIPHYLPESMYQHGIDFLNALARPTNAPPTQQAVGATLVKLKTATAGLVQSGEDIFSPVQNSGYGVGLGIGDYYLPANKEGSIYFVLSGPDRKGAMLLLTPTETLTGWAAAPYAMQINMALPNAIRIYGGATEPQLQEDTSLGWAYRLRRDATMMWRVDESRDGLQSWREVNHWPTPDARALYVGFDVLGQSRIRPYATGFVANGSGGGVGTPALESYRIFDFVPTEGVQNDGEDWASQVGTLVFHTQGQGLATFTEAGAQVAANSFYSTTAGMPLAPYRKFTLVLTVDIINDARDYQIFFGQKDSVGCLAVYYVKPENKIYMQMRCSPGADVQSNYRGFTAPCSGGVTQIRVAIDLDATGEKVRLVVNGTEGTRIGVWNGNPVELSNAVCDLFADGSGTNHLNGAVKRLTGYSKVLTDAEYATAAG